MKATVCRSSSRNIYKGVTCVITLSIVDEGVNKSRERSALCFWVCCYALPKKGGLNRLPVSFQSEPDMINMPEHPVISELPCCCY